MRRVTVLMQTTLDGRIARPDGTFWEPFRWGEAEQGWLNRVFIEADTWALSRVLYDAIVPWWDAVAAGHPPEDAGAPSAADEEFARIQHHMTKIVFSRSMPPRPPRERTLVWSGDLASKLGGYKARDGGGIILSAGPLTLGPLLCAPGLVDEVMTAIHPAVLPAGPRLYGGVTGDLALELVEAHAFDSGCVVLRYRLAGR